MALQAHTRFVGQKSIYVEFRRSLNLLQNVVDVLRDSLFPTQSSDTVLELSGQFNANLGLSCVSVRESLRSILLFCLPTGGITGLKPLLSFSSSSWYFYVQ